MDQAEMNSGRPEDSFARLNYHPGAAKRCLLLSTVLHAARKMTSDGG